MNGIDDFALAIIIVLIVFFTGGLFVQVSYVLYLLIGVLKDIKKTTDSINEGLKNADNIKENIANSIDDITYNFLNRQKLNAELVVVKGAYNLLKKLKR